MRGVLARQMPRRPQFPASVARRATDWSGEGGIMTYERLKKGLVSLIVSATVILSIGFAGSSIASAQRYDRDYQRHDDRWDQRREQAEMWRIRRLDREHQIRFRMNSSTRVAGY